jgi:hypothetical protein
MNLNFSSPAAVLAALGVAIASSVTATPTYAATFGCPIGSVDNVSGASACEYSNTATQDFLNSKGGLTVNQEEFFGVSTWQFGGKIGENGGYAGQGSGQSGTWNLSSVLQPTWQNVMLVFKSGAGTSLVGYQLEPGVTSGTWESPFEKLLFNVKNTKDVSHISVYFTLGEPSGSTGGGSSEAVPEPTTMAGIALAGAGLAAYRRRRTAA